MGGDASDMDSVDTGRSSSGKKVKYGGDSNLSSTLAFGMSQIETFVPAVVLQCLDVASEMYKITMATENMELNIAYKREDTGSHGSMKETKPPDQLVVGRTELLRI